MRKKYGSRKLKFNALFLLVEKTPRIYVGITIKTIYNLLFVANKLSVKSKRNIWYCPKLLKLI